MFCLGQLGNPQTDALIEHGVDASTRNTIAPAFHAWINDSATFGLGRASFLYSIYVRATRMLKALRLGLIAIMAALGASIHTMGQTIDPPNAKLGTILGTVLDTNGDPISGATATLQGADVNDRQVIVTSENGFFQFRNVKAGVSYR